MTLRTLIDRLRFGLDKPRNWYTPADLAGVLREALIEWAKAVADSGPDWSEVVRNELSFLTPPPIEGRGQQAILNDRMLRILAVNVRSSEFGWRWARPVRYDTAARAEANWLFVADDEFPLYREESQTSPGVRTITLLGGPVQYRVHYLREPRPFDLARLDAEWEPLTEGAALAILRIAHRILQQQQNQDYSAQVQVEQVRP